MKNAKADPNETRLGQYRYYDLIMALFVAVLLISNIASSAKIIDLGLSVGTLRLSIDAGTIIFPLSYIFGDILTEVYGYRRSRRVIWVGFGISALMTVILWVIGLLPGEAHWLQRVGQDSYDAILGGVSTGGIIVASIVAYFAGEFSNSYVLAKMKVWSQGRYLWTRTIGSTLVGEGVDTILFYFIATLLGVFSWGILWSLIVTVYVIKVVIEILMTPVTYQIVRRLKIAEDEDYYDYDTNFNPFMLREA